MVLTNNFEDGTTQGWGVGLPSQHPNPPANQASGGPDGADDNFLQTQANGGAGAGSRLAVFNENAEWTGDYIAGGVTGITASAINQGNANVVLRVALDGAGGRFVTTEGVTLSPGSDWQTAAFSIEAADLTAAGGTDVAATLSDVSQIRFINNATPSYQGSPVTAQVGIDNIATVGGEPGVIPVVTPPTGNVPVVSFETVPATFSEEDANNLVEWKWTVTGDLPEEGITVNLDTSGGGGAFAFTEQFAADPPSEFINSDIANFDPATGRLNILLTAPEASFKLYFVDDILEEGTQEFNFQLADGDGYTVDAETNGGLFTITDDRGGPGIGPTVGLTTSATELAEGDTFTITFTAEEDIPAEGVQVLVQSDVPGSLGQFDLADLGNITTTGLAGLPTVGDGGGGSFFVTMTEPTATITLDVFDDIVAEDPLPITFTVANGEEYEVDATNSDIVLNISDEAQPAGPTVSLNVDNTDLIEGGDPVTLTISVDGDIPEGGLPILINDAESAGNESRSLTEFDIANITTTGLAAFPTPADGDSGFFVTVTEPTATITLSAFDEGADENEAQEVFNFAVVDGEGYEVNPAAGSITLNIADSTVAPPMPPVVSDNDTVSTNNDIIANAQMLTLSTENPTLQVQGTISQRFEDDSNSVDATEDVDMYAVTLSAGDRITIDADSVTTDLEGSQVGPAPDITIFDADGNQVVVGTDADGEDIFAFSSRDGAPDEAFVANRDAYLDFTAPADGTYYIGTSQYRNNNYDPNEAGLGSGAFFSPRFGVSPGGEYTLDIALNPTGFSGPVFEAFTGTPNAGAPVVTFSTDAGTFVRAENRDDIVISSELIEDGDVGRGVLNVAFSVEGEIPDGGLEVSIVNEEGVDLNDYFQKLGGQPRIVVGGTLSGGLYSADGSLIGFKALITDNNALFPFTATTDREDDPDAPETLTFSLANSADYAANPAASSSEVTFFDSLEQVQANNGNVPTVGFTFDQTEFIESEGTVGTLTVNVDGDIPAEGLQVYIDSEDRLLGEFDVFNAEVTGGAFPSPNGTASGFFFRVFENTATITLAVFDETTNDQIPAEDALEGIESFSIALQPLEGYAIDAAAASVDFTIKDNPDSVVIPDNGSEGGEGGTGSEGGPITDNDGRSTIDDTLETAVATGLSADNSSVMVEGSIAVRWRNPDDQKADSTEDVDLYSFDLAAGESVSINASSVPFERNSLTQVTAPNLRIFDAAGNELAISMSDLTEGVVSDPEALSFTATEAGTYYVGVSQYLNDNYDPMVNASGDGVQLFADGISPGEYTLNIALSDAAPTLPMVGVIATPMLVAENTEGGASVTFTFTVDGEIPTVELDADGNYISGGLPIRYDGSSVIPIFDEIEGDPFYDGVEVTGFPTEAAPTEYEFTLLSNASTITLNIIDDVIQEAAEDYSYGIIASGDASYTVDPDANGGVVTLVDGQGGPGVGPSVGISVDKTELSEGDTFTVSFAVDGDIPAEGLEVLVVSPTLRSLGEFAIFDENNNPAVELEGISGFPVVYDGQGSSFVVTITEPTASLTLSVFDDGANEGLENLTFELVDGELYEIDTAASSISFSISDFDTVGTDESDTLVGDDMDNSLAGQGGNDLIAGGLANDIILGGDGDDVLRGDLNSRDPQDGGMGGNDIIFGGEGNDRIGGKAGNDILSGDAGDDFIWGDDGNDIIMGVTGNDTLVGDNGSNGSGSDLFVFGNGDGTDTILDFEVGTDRIGLVEGELMFADLTFTQDGSSALLGVASSGETLAILNNVQASALTESSFETVADVSNLDDAIALI